MRTSSCQHEPVHLARQAQGSLGLSEKLVDLTKTSFRYVIECESTDDSVTTACLRICTLFAFRLSRQQQRQSPVSTQASSAAVLAPGQWLGPKRNQPVSGTITADSVQVLLWNLLCNSTNTPAAVTEDDVSSRQFGVELTADQWQPWDFDPLDLSPQRFAVRCASQAVCKRARLA